MNFVRQKSYLLSWLVLLFFAVRSVIPAGFMPGQEMGQIALVICTGTGPATVYVPADKAPVSGEHHNASADICSFASVFSHAVTAFAQPFTHVVLNGDAARAYLTAFLLPAVAATPYKAQAPPFFS